MRLSPTNLAGACQPSPARRITPRWACPREHVEPFEDGEKPRGSIGRTPVHNVSVPVMKRDFWMFELEAEQRAAPPIH